MRPRPAPVWCGVDAGGEELSADAPGARKASDRRAGQVDDGVGAVDDDLVEATCAWVPERGVGQRVVSAHQPGDMNPLIAQVSAQRSTQESRCPTDDDVHAADQYP